MVSSALFNFEDDGLRVNLELFHQLYVFIRVDNLWFSDLLNCVCQVLKVAIVLDGARHRTLLAEEEGWFFIFVEGVTEIEGTRLLLARQDLAHELLKELDLTPKAAAHFSLSERLEKISACRHPLIRFQFVFLLDLLSYFSLTLQIFRLPFFALSGTLSVSMEFLLVQ